jgi:hypothetical protein
VPGALGSQAEIATQAKIINSSRNANSTGGVGRRYWPAPERARTLAQLRASR